MNKRRWYFKCSGNGKTYSVITTSFDRAVEVIKRDVPDCGYPKYTHSISWPPPNEAEHDDMRQFDENARYRKDQYDRINKKVKD